MNVDENIAIASGLQSDHAQAIHHSNHSAKVYDVSGSCMWTRRSDGMVLGHLGLGAYTKTLVFPVAENCLHEIHFEDMRIASREHDDAQGTFHHVMISMTMTHKCEAHTHAPTRSFSLFPTLRAKKKHIKHEFFAFGRSLMPPIHGRATG